jgi:hypothetical protein
MSGEHHSTLMEAEKVSEISDYCKLKHLVTQNVLSISHFEKSCIKSPDMSSLHSARIGA